MANEQGGESRRVRWGILGTGFIADAFATGVAQSMTGALGAVASRSQASADAFAARHPGFRSAHPSYEALVDDPEVDAVYVATPHPFHREWAVRAARSGKAVLCEKPVGMSAVEAAEMVEAAKANGTFLMEAYMYRLAPQTAAIAKLVSEGALGQVMGVAASFCFRAPFDPGARLFNPLLGGGGILDVGGYTVTMAGLVAGAAGGGTWEAPTHFSGTGLVGESGVDEYAVATARYPSGVVAQLSCGVGVEENPGGLAIFGTGGSLRVPDAWIPSKFGGSSEMVLHRPGEGSEVIVVESPDFLYALEADAAGRAILAGRREPEWPALGWAESESTMAVLDNWRREVGSGLS
ncbi:hypothetical protein BH23VER1_BH23VER1_07910 [soil metagenome]